MQYLMREAMGMTVRDAEQVAARQEGLTVSLLRDDGQMVPCEGGELDCSGWVFKSHIVLELQRWWLHHRAETFEGVSG